MLSFSFQSPPLLQLESGLFSRIPALLKAEGFVNIAFISGKSSLRKSGKLFSLLEDFDTEGICYQHFELDHEPDPDFIDDAVSQLKQKAAGPQMVLSIGGGSVIDAGKAISAMMRQPGSVQAYLEKVGDRKPEGKKIPFWAMPTTAGTGAEATKNAVISRPGKFKASLRHDVFIPDRAYLDASLQLDCPPSVTAASAMDALSQLLESFLSTKANPLTEAWAMEGLALAGSALLRLKDNLNDLAAREQMALAAYLSGVCLANAGLGLVHGIAGPLGGMLPVPHGAACAALLLPVIKETLVFSGQDKALSQKMKQAARLISADNKKSGDLILALEALMEGLPLPALAELGFEKNDAAALAEKSAHKNHPCKISQAKIKEIIISAI